MEDRGELRKICEVAKVLQELQSHGEEEEEDFCFLLTFNVLIATE
jgi:hypothetical protein